MRKHMKKLFYLLLVFILISCGSEKTANIFSDTSIETSKEISSIKITSQSIISKMEKGKYKEGELLVKFKSGVIGISSSKIHQAVGASVIKRFNVVPNLERIKLPEGISVEKAILQYMSDPAVEYAEPNYIRCASSITPPTDTYFNTQWALNNTGEYANGTKGADINALGAWGYTKGSHDITVAVLDSGIDYNHQDLAGNIWFNAGEANCVDRYDYDGNNYKDDCIGWDFANDNNNPMDDVGHGTHVAGIIGAKGDNGLGIAGVMWNVKLMALKIFGTNTTQTEGCIGGFVADEIAAIDYATAVETVADGEKRAAIKKAEGIKQANILKAEGEAEAIRLVNDAANKYFVGNAQLLKKLETVQNSLQNNTKVVVPGNAELVNVIGDLAGVLPMTK